MDRIIGVAVGLVTMYLMLSILASHIQELLAANSQSRSKLLSSAITTLLGSQTLTQVFYAHPLVKALLPAAKNGASNTGKVVAPSYIPAEIFRKVLLTLLGQTYSPQATALKDILANMPDNDLRQSLSAITMDVTDQAGITSAIENWYLSAMDRTIGLYKLQTQGRLLIVGFALAVAFNANTFHTAEVLWTSSSARDQAQLLAQQCIQGKNQTCDNDSTVNVKNLETSIGKLPVGWTAESKAALASAWHNWGNAEKAAKGSSQSPPDKPQPVPPQPAQPQSTQSQQAKPQPLQAQTTNPQSVNQPGPKYPRVGQLGNDGLMLLTMLAGWLFTAVAVSWGAPFWFDLLNQIVNLRIAGPKPDSSGSGPAKAAAKTTT